MPFVRSVTEPRKRAVRALRSSGVITPNSSETRCTPSTGASACATCCSKLERSGHPATVSAMPTVTSPPSTRTSRTMSSSTTFRLSSGSMTCSSAFRIASRWGSITMSLAEERAPEPLLEAAQQQVEPGVENLLPRELRRVRRDLPEARKGGRVERLRMAPPRRLQVLVGPGAAAQQRRVHEHDQGLVRERGTAFVEAGAAERIEQVLGQPPHRVRPDAASVDERER